MNKPIAILTDFGIQDPFVGIMKGVIQSIAPGTLMIDLNHKIPPGDIRRTATTLWQSLPYFPKNSIFLVVVDPGVGTYRRAIIAQKDGYTFVGPDNGVLSFILDEQAQAWELANPELMLPTPRSTFHGRDIFAPAAAHASQGVPGSKFGDIIPDLVWLPDPKLDTSLQGKIFGEILHADHFGNLLTSLGLCQYVDPKQWQFKPWIGKSAPFSLNLTQSQLNLPNGKNLPFAKTFGEIPAGECAALIGSSGLVEIAANSQSAAEILGLSIGDTISIHYL